MRVINRERLEAPFIAVEFTRSEAAAIARIARAIGGRPSGPRNTFTEFAELCREAGMTENEMPKTDGRCICFE
jgi:hypothetical protein